MIKIFVQFHCSSLYRNDRFSENVRADCPKDKLGFKCFLETCSKKKPIYSTRIQLSTTRVHWSYRKSSREISRSLSQYPRQETLNMYRKYNGNEGVYWNIFALVQVESSRVFWTTLEVRPRHKKYHYIKRNLKTCDIFLQT